MTWSKNKRFEKIVYLLLAAALLILVGSSLFQAARLVAHRVINDFFYPYLNVPADLKHSLSDKTLLKHDKYTLAARVEQLSRDNLLLAAKAAANAELAIDNEELRKLLRLRQRRNYDFIPAEIIIRNPQGWQESFTINKGSYHGVTKGALILTVPSTGGGEATAVGVVRNLARYSAEVATIVNPGTKLAAMLPRSGAFGFLNGGEDAVGEGLAGITYLSPSKPYQLDEPVLTAGAREQIPAGILLGTLVEIEPAGSIFSNRLYLSAKVKPSANLDNIRFVAVAVKK